MLRAFFHLADEARRQQGRMLDCLGFGPRTTCSRTVRSRRVARLLAYQRPDARQPAILMVPAPIKAAYIWDIGPGSSAVARCLAAGLQAYLIEWQRPQSGDEAMGLAQYADTAILDSVDEIRAETGQAKVLLAGHSLGGTLAALFASLHPERVRALIALEGPMAFATGRLEAAVADSPSATAISRALGNVPGTFLDWASAYAEPLTFNLEPWADWMASRRAPAAHRLHWQVRRWSLEETPLAQRLFEEVVENLYRDNLFAKRRLHVGGRLADPRAITAPVLGVLDRGSRVVPPSSIEAYRAFTASADVEILEYPGDCGVMLQHVGVLVGRNAHTALWPRILSWTAKQLQAR